MHRLGSLLSVAVAVGMAAVPGAGAKHPQRRLGRRLSRDTRTRPGPELGDYLGIPLNAAARQYADSWDASRLTLPEHQCRAHVSPYIYRGPDPGAHLGGDRSRHADDIAIKHFLSTYAQERTIWLDGRPHPPEEAPHTWMGFSTGEWQGTC